MKITLSVLIALALLVGTCSPVLSVFAKSEPAEQTKIASTQTPGKMADLLPEKPTKHEVKKLEQSKAMWEVVTGPFSSAHNYADNTYYRWIYGNSDPNVTNIEIAFSSATMIEWEYDFIELYDDNDNMVGSYTGDQLAGKTITVFSKGFTLVFYSDESDVDYGFDVTGITPKTNTVLSGSCGTNLNWSFDIQNGKLDITGNGDMFTFDYNSVPWNTFRSYIKDAVVGAGATSISDFAFADCFVLSSLSLGAGMVTIGDYAFAYCYELLTAVITGAVKTIGISAFEGCEYLQTVTIGASVETIGDYAFAWCYELTSADIPESVTFIGAYAFCETGISAVTFHNGLLTIGDYAFAGCYQLGAVSLPNSLEELYQGAFIACELLFTVTIPESVNYIGSFVFASCYGLEEILVDSNNQDFISQDGVLFDANETILIQYPIGKIVDEYDIPYGVETIGSGAFAGCWLNWVYLPDTVTDIQQAAFAECGGIYWFNIPDSVQTIGESAFYSCYNLYGVDFGYRVSYVGDGAFWGCENLNEAYFYGNAPMLGMGVFEWCGSYFTVYYICGKTGFDSWGYPTSCIDGQPGVFGDGEWIDGTLPVKVKWSKSYKKVQMQLDFSSIVRDIADVSWQSDNSKVDVDPNGLITNLRTGARSANITVTIRDLDGNEYSNTVKVIFYKYNWQLKKLQSQSVVSDNYAQRNLSAEEYNKLEQDRPDTVEPVGIMQYVVDVMNYIFSIFQKFVS